MRSYGCVRVSLPLRPDDRVRCSMLSGSSGQKFFNDFSELVRISIYAKSLKSLANLAETVQTDPGSRWAVERGPGDSLWAFFCCLDAQNGLTFTGTARRRFSPLSAGSSVLDALWIVAIILEQPAYALVVPSGQSALDCSFCCPRCCPE